jgi:hypothetical protein
VKATQLTQTIQRERIMATMYLSASIVVLGALSFVSVPSALGAASVNSVPNPTAIKNFDQAVDRAESLQLPLNKVFLYRQAAVALAPTDKPRAVMLLKRALSDIDAAETDARARGTLDDETLRLLEFHRLPVIMLMERIDPTEACNMLMPLQSADNDMTVQTLFFERLKNPEFVQQVALRKLGNGVTPAVIAAYGVLKKSSPDVARSLGAAIVMKLTKSDAANDPEAVHSAFLLTHLLRTDVGALAPQMIIDPDLMTPALLGDLFAFIGDAFVASKNPEMLILGENPKLYVAALEQYAFTKSQDVKLLDFAAPEAKSMIMTPEKPVFDANHPDPATLTPEQLQARAAMKAQVEAQMKDSEAQIDLLAAKLKQPALTEKERDETVFALVDQANKSITMARAAATALEREAFRDGELEFYNLGAVTGVVDSVSAVLQVYAIERPMVAEAAARNLDGHEVQTEVELQIAIQEMTGGPSYLVPPAKPPVDAHRSATPLAIVAPPAVP